MNNKQLFTVFLLATIIFSCAKRGRPTGGPKDEDAPAMVVTKPPFKTTNFKSDEIKIYFDEFIKLKDLNKQLVISPPLKYNPIITPQGTPSKFIKIEILDTLRKNTTYTFNFGQSVIDNTEGNVLRNFSYIFSTGNTIDSLSVSGTVKDAFNEKADTEVTVMLYEYDEKFNDSTIYKEKPYYVASTLDSTVWTVNNMKEGKYKLLALKQASRDYKFKPSTDKIAFLDTIIQIPTEQIFNLTLFKEEPKFKVNRPSELSKNRYLVGYVGNADSIKIRDLSGNRDFKSAITFEKDKDSLNFWYKNAVVDTLQLEFSNKNYKDTLVVRRRSKKVDSLDVYMNVKGTLHPQEQLKLMSNIPLQRIDTTKIFLTDKDSTKVNFNVSFKELSTEAVLNFKRKQSNQYNLKVFPDAITDFYGVKNDSLNFRFLTKKPSDYGNVYLKLQNAQYPLIIQLLSEQGKVLRQIYATEEKEFNFLNLEPASYKIRVLIDENGNKKWDSGNYLKKIHPEKVAYYPEELKVRANFEMPITFILQ